MRHPYPSTPLAFPTLYPAACYPSLGSLVSILRYPRDVLLAQSYRFPCPDTPSPCTHPCLLFVVVVGVTFAKHVQHGDCDWVDTLVKNHSLTSLYNIEL